MKPQIVIWTDGSCYGGRGGWAALLLSGRKSIQISGGRESTTSQRMELTAALEALRALRRPSVVALHSDSAYLIECFRQRWYLNWYRKGWMSSSGEAVANRDLWEALLVEEERHEIKWVKVAGHAGLRLNEEADRLAVRARHEGHGYLREPFGRLASRRSNESKH